jgi:seryl-tRNA synthetase
MKRERHRAASQTDRDAAGPVAPGDGSSEDADGDANDQRFRDALLHSGLFVPSGVPGIYGHGRTLVDLMVRLETTVSRFIHAGDIEVMRFPPVVSRVTVERTGYHQAFPHLLGTVSTFSGDDIIHARMVRARCEAAGPDDHRAPSDLALTPAACHAVYPHLAGALPEGGRTVDVESWCFRQEPSDDPGRLRAFRMRELVRFGEPDAVLAWRDHWIERGVELLRALGLDPSVAPAADPFFGRVGKMLARSQRAQALKFELLVPAASTSGQMAIMSCNYHQEHFGEAFDIRTRAGRIAHTACVGFGLDRWALALLWAYGLDPARWPDGVRDVLDIDAA